MTGAALYAELKVAISLLLISSRIAPLTWNFDHIVSAFNNFPALESLYSFGRLSNFFIPEDTVICFIPLARKASRVGVVDERLCSSVYGGRCGLHRL